MSVFKLFLKEWRSIFKNKMTLLSVIGLFFIPILYCGVFLWGFWDPYGKVDKLPVAVVNSDIEAKIDDKTINVGKEFVDDLKDNDKFDWHFINKKEADEGLKKHKYYMIIEVPKNFSKKVATLNDKEPQRPELKYVQDESFNFVAAQIGKKAIEEIKNEVSHSISRQYADVVFDKIKEASDGFQEAADGSKEITDGMSKVNDGTDELLTKLKDKTSDVNSLAKGSNDLKDGTLELKKGTQQTLEAFKPLKEGSKAVESGINQLGQGTQALSKGMKDWGDGAIATLNGSKQLTDGLQQYLAKHPELQTDAEFLTLVGTSQAVTGGVEKLSGSSKKIQDGVNTVSGNMNALAKGQTKITDGISKLEDAQSKIHNGSVDLSNGTEKLAEGNKSLYDGWLDIISGVKKLKDGEVEVLDGNKELTTNLKKAADESKEFKPTDKTLDMFSDPVVLDKQSLHDVSNYGTGLAPYMISISLFIGALMLTIVLDIQKTPAIPRTGFGLFFSKLVTLTIVGVMQSLIVDAVLIHVVGLKVNHLSNFITLTILTSMTFLALIQMLVKPLGNVGRFVAVIILICQITSTGGTFPVELIPSQLQAIHNWLPMTYSVQGFRAAISSNETSTLISSMQHLLMFFGAFALVTWSYAFIRVRILKKTVE
ncbi:YhgE/Pip domain-containing protein [Bacillus thuringiensis]|uniref:YhgE/Pip domain-containing protein n=1 Tax=Bacillus thuringiensis TaxID=1428 RepID=UPI0021D64F51|nr:YhgE/Pip domain-containing protein [Bacillus thuringiensis]MCU7667665.1 YhgE/Pip domain-containing protein [Bacillus thuringiensis]